MQKIKKTTKHRCLVCGKELPNKTLVDKKRKYCSTKCSGIASRYDYKKAHRKRSNNKNVNLNK